MSLNIYLLRHGQTAFSRDNDFCGSGMDPELTAEGHKMALAFAEFYESHPWQAIYCSPLLRARLTAAPISEAVHLPAIPLDGLKEIAYGEWEGKTLEDVQEQFHDDYIKWSADPAWYAPTNGETAVTIANRVMDALESIRSAHADGPVLVVSHKATIRILLCGLLGIDVGRYRYRLDCPVGSVSHVEFTPHGPLVRTVADRSHLPENLRDLAGT